MPTTGNTGFRLSRRRMLLTSAAMLSAGACVTFPQAISREVEGRRTVSFDTGWRFWRGDLPGGQSPTLNDSGWRELDLPHDWSIEDAPGAPPTSDPWVPPVANWTIERLNGTIRPKMGPIITSAYPETAVPGGPPLRVGPFDPVASGSGWGTGWVLGGVGWYRKSFILPDLAANDQVEITFDGAFRETEVWLNGVLVGSNDHGYGGFAFDLTPHLRRGEINIIAARVANIGETSRWYSGSGINRHVWLAITGPVRIAPWGVGITTPSVSPEQAEISVEVDLGSVTVKPVRLTILARIMDNDDRLVGEAQGEALSLDAPAPHRLSMHLERPRLWSPESPYLYRAEVSVLADGRVTDRVTMRFGVRKVAVSPAAGLTINGHPVKLRGGCVHADHGILGTAAIDAAEYRKVALLKSYGYNAVRLSHNMFPPAFLHACDEAGLLVVDELFDTWEETKVFANDYASFFEKNWRRDVEHWIRRDRNHPSVVFWCIGNEIPERVKPRGVAISAQLREAILAIDTTRLITSAINGPTGKEGEPARRGLDVIGYNYAQQAFEPDHAAEPGLVFMSTEQSAEHMHEGWRLTEAHPYVLGEFIWSAIDYLGEVGVGGTKLRPIDQAPRPQEFGIFLWDYPVFQSGCGEIDILGVRKPQGRYRDVLWGRSALELLVQRPTPPGTYEWTPAWAWHDELESWTWTGTDSQPMTIRAYTSGDEVRLTVNGREVARKAVAAADRLIATFETPYEPGEIIATAFQDGRQIARKSLETVGAPAQVRLRTERPVIAASPNDLAYVFADILDAQGRKVPDAAVELTFVLEGAGNLRATGSANPRGIKSFSDPRTRTFHGEAVAILQGTAQPGRATLRVASPGLQSTAIEVRIG